VKEFRQKASRPTAIFRRSVYRLYRNLSISVGLSCLHFFHSVDWKPCLGALAVAKRKITIQGYSRSVESQWCTVHKCYHVNYFGVLWVMTVTVVKRHRNYSTNALLCVLPVRLSVHPSVCPVPASNSRLEKPKLMWINVPQDSSNQLANFQFQKVEDQAPDIKEKQKMSPSRV